MELSSPPKSARGKLSHPIDACVVFFITYGVYLLTVYPSVGTEDSGELITSAAALDIAHPPGYPLHTLLGKLFTILIPFGNMGWRVNLLSAFFGAATITCVYLIIKHLTKKTALSMSGALFLGFSDILWSQSIRTETYALHAFSLSVVVLLLLLWSSAIKHPAAGEKPHHTWLYWSALCYGLGLANQHQILLALPAIGIFVALMLWQSTGKKTGWLKRIKNLLKPVAGCMALLLLGLSVYAYLPIRTALGPYDNPAYIQHKNLHTWENFSAFVNRNIYGGTIPVKKPASQETAEIKENPLPGWKLAENIINNNIRGFIPLMAELAKQLLFLPILFFLPGIYWLWKQRKDALLLLGLLLFLHTVIQLHFVGYQWDMNPFNRFSARPFLIPAIMFTLIIAWVGIWQWLEGMNGLYAQAKKHRAESRGQPQATPNNPAKQKNSSSLFGRRMFPVTFFLLLPLIPLTLNFASNNESGNWLAYDFNRHVLESLPPGAHLLSIGRDNHTFPLYYLQKVEKVRPDVEVEIYYSRKTPTTETFKKLRQDNPGAPIFVDLLPHHYNTISLTPYNFVYRFEETSSSPFPSSRAPALPKVPPDQAEIITSVSTTPPTFPVRGIREIMDYPNSKLKAIYFIKMAILRPEQQEDYFMKVEKEVPFIEQFQLVINDWRKSTFNSGMF